MLTKRASEMKISQCVTGILLSFLLFIDYVTARQTVYLLEQGCYTPQTWPTLWPSMDQIQSFPIPDSRVISVRGFLRVQLSRNPIEFNSKDKFACKVAFVASQPGKRLLLHWKFFVVGEYRYGVDWLNVLDQGSDLELSGKMWGAQDQATKGMRPPPTTDYHSISPGFSLAYKGRPYHDVFTLYLTEFEDVMLPNKICPEGLFFCQPGYPMCISPDMVCNSVPNCGSFSNSDEDPEVCVTAASRLSEKAGTPVGLIGALCGIVVTALIVAAIATSVYFIKRNRQHMVHEHRISKPRNIDTLAEINAYRPKAQNIYNRPETIIKQSRPPMSNSQGGATGIASGDTYHNNDSYSLSQDSMQLVHLAENPDDVQPVYELIAANHRGRHPGESHTGVHQPHRMAQTGLPHPNTSHMVAPPFVLPGMNTQPFSHVYRYSSHDAPRSWPSHNAVYYNDMGEETPLYQEI